MCHNMKTLLSTLYEQIFPKNIIQNWGNCVTGKYREVKVKEYEIHVIKRT